jgi:hypothetical protein
VDFVLVHIQAGISRPGLFLKQHLGNSFVSIVRPGDPKLRGPFKITLSQEPAASIYKAEQSATLKTVVADSFEMSVPFYRTIWHHIPEYGNLRSFLVDKNVKHVTYTCLTFKQEVVLCS